MHSEARYAGTTNRNPGDFGWDVDAHQAQGGPEPHATTDGWIAIRRDRCIPAASSNKKATRGWLFNVAIEASSTRRHLRLHVILDAYLLNQIDLRFQPIDMLFLTLENVLE